MKVIAILLLVIAANIAVAQKPVKKATKPAGVVLSSDAPVQAQAPVNAPKQSSTLPSEASVAPIASPATAKGPQGVLPSAAPSQGVDKAPAPAKQ